MNITYDWKITALKKAPSLDGLSDVITNIRFEYKGTDQDSGETFSFQGACPVGAPSGDSFTPLAELTEENVIEWAKANHPTDHMNEVVEKGIKAKIQPVNEDVTELDWLPTQPAPVTPDEAETTEETE